ncbi:MAG: hypothetical protein GY804_05170 [Alphaproteobacteria bacterium]|nr:hypothetical protein [Alphaproteobacteria bacterium]
MLTLKFILDTLNNDFSDNRIIKRQKYTKAVITNGKITVKGINAIFPVNCYIKVSGTVFNNNYHKITASGNDYIEATTLVADSIKKVVVKACLIPKEILDFSLIDHKVPALQSETIGNYSYTTTTPGVEAFIKSKLAPYYQAVRI